MTQVLTWTELCCSIYVACAAVGGFRDSTGATATLKFQNNTPLKYIAELNTGDTLEFKVEIGSSDKIQEVKMLFGIIEEI